MGIGKFYMGREIAQVMGHQRGPIGWERPERDQEGEHHNADRVCCGIRPGGRPSPISAAGTGYISRRLARKVWAKGVVLAEEIQPEMLTILNQRMARPESITSRSVPGTTTDPKTSPAGVDVVLMVDVYHEFDSPWK